MHPERRPLEAEVEGSGQAYSNTLIEQQICQVTLYSPDLRSPFSVIPGLIGEPGVLSFVFSCLLMGED